MFALFLLYTADLGLLLGTEAPVTMPNGAHCSFSFFLFTQCGLSWGNFTWSKTCHFGRCTASWLIDGLHGMNKYELL